MRARLVLPGEARDGASRAPIGAAGGSIGHGDGLGPDGARHRSPKLGQVVRINPRNEGSPVAIVGRLLRSGRGLPDAELVLWVEPWGHGMDTNCGGPRTRLGTT